MHDPSLLNKAIKGKDYVFHFAGVADIGYAKNNPRETYKDNVMGTLNILESSKSNNIKRIIFASSVYVYSELGSFYRSSKQSCEMLIENFQEEYSLPFSILRFGSLYGPRANEFNFIRNSIYSAISKKKILRKGTGNELRDYIHVKDAAMCVFKILEKKYENEYVMIKGNQTMKVKEILETINEIFGGSIKIQYSKKEHYDAHYSLTPFSFRPKSARQIQLDSYYDIGQGIQEAIYDLYEYLEDHSKKK